MENTPISPRGDKAAISAAEKRDRYSWRYAVVTFVFLLWWNFSPAIEKDYSFWLAVRNLHGISLIGVVFYLLAAVVISSLKAHFARLISIIFGSLFTFLAFTLIAQGLSDEGLSDMSAQQVGKTPEQIEDQHAIAEDYREYHDGEYTWFVDRSKIFTSPDGSHLATLELGHMEPYFVAPPLFARVFLGKQGERRSKDIVVYGVWNPLGMPDVEWLPDGKLQLTSRYADNFYRCRHHAAGIDVVHVLGQEMKPESFRLALDEKVRKMERRRSTGPQDEKSQQEFEENSIIFKQRIEDDWKRYLRFMEYIRNNIGTKEQCFIQP